MLHKDLVAGKLFKPDDYQDFTAGSIHSGNSLQPEKFTAKYLNLKSIHDLHTGTVKHCLHNVMTPVSAISGYLDLLNERLNRGEGDEKLERYSRKIAEGIHEVGFLLEQLHDMYRMESQNSELAEYPEVNLNWLAEEVADIINGSFELTAEKVVCTVGPKPIFIHADLFQIKLIIYHLITSADQFTTSDSRIEIETGIDGEDARLTIRCTGETIPNETFIDLFQEKRRTADINSMAANGSAVHGHSNGSGAHRPDANRTAGESMSPDDSAATGLMISCRIAEQIDGDIVLISDNKDNPLFRCTAPLAAVQQFI
ncbi:MAG: HAMP domain-containing sensor histidine kinase [Terrimicrobiaceae bacterium]